MSITELESSRMRLTDQGQDLTTHLIGSNQKHNLNAEILYHKPGQDGATATRQQYHLREANHLDTRTATVHDVRGSKADYTLENNGFQ